MVNPTIDIPRKTFEEYCKDRKKLPPGKIQKKTESLFSTLTSENLHLTSKFFEFSMLFTINSSLSFKMCNLRYRKNIFLPKKTLTTIVGKNDRTTSAAQQ